MADILILGGTRNLGHVTALSLIEAGHDVSVLNRGQTHDELPPEVTRLRANRGDDAQMKSALGSRTFDLVLDNTTYTEADAIQAVKLFSGRTGRYVFVSSGQVYLVRENVPRPFRESDYTGPVMPEPSPGSADHASWLYGIDKRVAEAVFDFAHAETSFPVTVFRLPMVASERDHYGRIQGYIARLTDGGPLLFPDEEGLPLRHVYATDVARLVTSLVGSSAGVGEAFNISYGESLSLEAFIELLASATGSSARMLRVDRRSLEESGLLPACSPFSGRWMSELDNSRSLDVFGGLSYTAPPEYLPGIVEDYVERWAPRSRIPDGYAQRERELAFAAAL